MHTDFACFDAYTTHMPHASEGLKKAGITSSGNGTMEGWELPHCSWEPSPGCLQKKRNL